jgi:drug/metabolite transporter (DMT)-like permease
MTGCLHEYSIGLTTNLSIAASSSSLSSAASVSDGRHPLYPPRAVPSSPTPLSLSGLVRCTVIIVTALLKAFVLKDHLEWHMWLGVWINLIAMGLVSATTFFDRENQIGTGMVIVSMFEALDWKRPEGGGC